MMLRAELKRNAKNTLTGNWGTCILSDLIAGGILTVSTAVIFGPLVLTGPFRVGRQSLYNRVSDRENPEINDLFSGFSVNFGENFLVHLLKGIYTFLWTLLFIIPGIVKSCSYAMAEYLMARDRTLGSSEAIRTSMELMNGHKMDLFVLQLSFIGWDLLTMLTCGILSLYVVPYRKATTTEFFNEIYRTSGKGSYSGQSSDGSETKKACFCSSCGSAVSPGYKYCSNCGARVE